ncbi:unnamed protein product [Symbiodinium necroappetens]|uniref:Pentatricopeptide repeat-containing protein, chloroplastic n=1 Tax=Symbiodinium necroappetens TaxID=1628268 RepID=A0A812K1B9_9DINO|nr:unnamed protein product [Symbiodinium necroappetens]
MADGTGLELAWKQTLMLCSQAITEYGLRQQWRESTHLLAVTNEESVAPDLQLYKKAANACREAGQWEACVHMLRNLGQLRQAGLQADVVIVGTVMASAAKLVSSKDPWDMATLAKWRRGLHILQGAAQDGIQPDPTLIGICISACGKGKTWEPASFLLADMRWKTLQVEDAYAGAQLAALNCDNGWPSALALFRDLRHRPQLALTTAALNAAMLAADLGERPGRALRLLLAVQRLGLVETNVLSVTMGLTCLDEMIEGTSCEPPSRWVAWEMASRIFDDSRKNAVEPNRVTYTSLVGLHDKAGRWEFAQLLVHQSRLARVAFDSAAYRAAMQVTLGQSFAATLAENSPLSPRISSQVRRREDLAMSRSLLRVPLATSLSRTTKAALPRYRLAPRQDDLRHATRRPGSWDAAICDEENIDHDDENLFPDDSASLATRDPWSWVPQAGPSYYDEFYGQMSNNKWRAKWWNPAAGLPQQPGRRATIQADIAQLVASGQPKEEVYRAIREAYDVSGGFLDEEEDDRDNSER